MRQQGKGNTVQRIDEGVRMTQHIAALRVLEGAVGDWAYALCGATPGDGLGGLFYAVAAGELEDDDLSAIVTPHGIAWRRDVPTQAGASPIAYQGQREMSGSEPLESPSFFVIAHEIPVTLVEGRLYSVSWMLGLSAAENAAARYAAVRFYLAEEEGSWEGALTVTAFWQRLYPADVAIRDTPSGTFPLISTGNSPAVPIVPGDYWLRMLLLEEISTTGTLNLYDFHPPMLQLTEHVAGPEPQEEEEEE